MPTKDEARRIAANVAKLPRYENRVLIWIKTTSLAIDLICSSG
jgi:hypothetical protein